MSKDSLDSLKYTGRLPHLIRQVAAFFLAKYLLFHFQTIDNSSQLAKLLF
jgi:hypothetical protein